MTAKKGREGDEKARTSAIPRRRTAMSVSFFLLSEGSRKALLANANALPKAALPNSNSNFMPGLRPTIDKATAEVENANRESYLAVVYNGSKYSINPREASGWWFIKMKDDKK